MDKDAYHHGTEIVKTVANVIKKFVEHTDVLITAEMQSGKTDCMRRMLYVINNHNQDLQEMGIHIERYNVYVILCASSINLKLQLKTKLPEIPTKIFHLNDIIKFLSNPYEYSSLFVRMATDSLVIFDESHCDAEVGKTIDRLRKKLNEISEEYSTDYYKLATSATPYEQVYAGYAKVIMKPASGYYGLQQMFKQKNVVQSMNLENATECNQLFKSINLTNRYYIFRLPSSKEQEVLMMKNVETHFKKSKRGSDSYIYDMNYRDNINNLINHRPKKPTIIYLRDKLRMGEYLNTRYVHLVHDNPDVTYSHTVVQSLIGRCCGYGKMENGTLIYCDYEKAYQHYQWIKSGYRTKKIPMSTRYINRSQAATKEICIY